MLRIDRQNQSFTLLETPTLADVSITERYDLQEFISNSPQAFFSELGLELFLAGKEIEPSQTVQDRIDLLAIDKEGAVVIVELKRGNHKFQLLQAISYAGMISHWTPDDFRQLLDESKLEDLVNFLEVDIDEVNRSQRIVLIAEAFDYALLIAAEWLSDRYGVNVMCCRVSIARDSSSGSEYLVCSNVYPAPELVQQAIPRGRRTTTLTEFGWVDWDSALAIIDNPAVVQFYQEQLTAGQESYLKKRTLHYRITGKRRWFVEARRTHAYVWQHERFEGDVDFWRAALSDPDSIRAVKQGKCLSFNLATKSDFEFFLNAATRKLLQIEWKRGGGEAMSDQVAIEDMPT